MNAGLNAAVESAAEPLSRVGVFNGYVGVFIVAFMVTLLATPVMRWLAVSNGIIDRPSDPRKVHRIPVAYLGGAAVFLGLVAALLYSVLAVRIDFLAEFHPSEHILYDAQRIMPWSIMVGLSVIMLVGLLDDVIGISPSLKIAGQLFAAAALAADQIGVQVARGLIMPTATALGIEPVEFGPPDAAFQTIGFWIHLPMSLPMIGDALQVDLVYWCGAAIIAVFVLGGCNASNLIDGLDGL
ncbi:MAG: hypothetical protein AAGF47_10620, partial [Planctomycetota bacterium]